MLLLIPIYVLIVALIVEKEETAAMLNMRTILSVMILCTTNKICTIPRKPTFAVHTNKAYKYTQHTDFCSTTSSNCASMTNWFSIRGRR
jgi:TRAP-type uncharacterized transport system fused permease subunit